MQLLKAIFLLSSIFFTLDIFAYPPLVKEEFIDIVKFSQIITKDCDRESCIIIGIGRSPTPFMAYLQNDEHKVYPKSISVPLSGLSDEHAPEISNKLEESKRLKLFKHFEKFLNPQQNFQSIKKIIVFDYADTGKSVLLAAHYLDDYINNHLNKSITVHLKAIVSDSKAIEVADFFDRAKALPTLGTMFQKVIPDTKKQIVIIPDNTELAKSLLKKKYGPASEFKSFLLNINDDVKKISSKEYLNLKDLIARFHNLLSLPSDGLASNLYDDNPEVRLSVVHLMSQIQEPSELVFDALVKLLDHKDIPLRAAAIRALASLKAYKPAHVLPLVQKLRDNDKLIETNDYVEIRSIAVEALGKIQPNDESVIKAIIDLLEDTGERFFAARALGAIKNRGENVVNALLEKMSSSKSSMLFSHRVAEALVQINPPGDEYISKLVLLLVDPNDTVRSRAWYCLKNSIPLSNMTFRQIINHLTNNDKNIRKSIAFNLQIINPEFKQIQHEETRLFFIKYLNSDLDLTIDQYLGKDRFKNILNYF